MLSKSSRLLAFILSVLLLGILKYAVDDNANTLPQVLQLVVHVSVPVACGLITLSFCSLLGTFRGVGNSATSNLLRQASRDPARNFFAGFLITAYLFLVRPPLTFNMPFLPYVEWATVALAVYVMYTMIRLSPKEFYVSSEGLHWKRHIQEVKRETGRDLIRISSAMEQFVDQGVKEPLLISLTLHRQRLGETEEEIVKTLRPLIDYQEDGGRQRLSLLAFPWKKRKFAMRNKKTRENLLTALLDGSGGLRSE